MKNQLDYAEDEWRRGPSSLRICRRGLQLKQRPGLCSAVQSTRGGWLGFHGRGGPKCRECTKRVLQRQRWWSRRHCLLKRRWRRWTRFLQHYLTSRMGFAAKREVIWTNSRQGSSAGLLNSALEYVIDQPGIRFKPKSSKSQPSHIRPWPPQDIPLTQAFNHSYLAVDVTTSDTFWENL